MNLNDILYVIIINLTNISRGLNAADDLKYTHTHTPSTFSNLKN